MADLNDLYESILIDPLDTGFKVTALKFTLDENGEVVVIDGVKQYEQTTHGFTSFSDVATWFGTLTAEGVTVGE